eukprot:1136624-Pelagomonas_calceolata.AAC.2
MQTGMSWVGDGKQASKQACMQTDTSEHTQICVQACRGPALPSTDRTECVTAASAQWPSQAHTMAKPSTHNDQAKHNGQAKHTSLCELRNLVSASRRGCTDMYTRTLGTQCTLQVPTHKAHQNASPQSTQTTGTPCT